MTMPYQAPPEQQTTGGQFPPPGVTINIPPTAPAAPPAISPELRAIFDAELNAERERVRQEEKNKLYPKIDELTGQVTVLAQEREERIAAEQAAQQQAAEAERLRQEAEMSANDRIAQLQSDNDRRFAEIEAERARERAINDRENEFRALEDYKARVRAENVDLIVPQLLDFITGGTREAIDASVANLIERSNAMMADIAAQMGIQQQEQRRTVGMPVTGAPAIDMARMGEEGQRTFTDAELRAMPIEEYAKLRPQLMGAVRQQVSERGLYGG
jgi:hypothetical protein